MGQVKSSGGQLSLTLTSNMGKNYNTEVMKNIKINKYIAEHLYELSLQNFQPKCSTCDWTKTKLEKFLGKKIVARVKRIVNKHPYKL